jgi:predicted dehydrogenase
MDFLDHGAHVLCEKPLAPSAAEVDAIVARATERGLHVSVNHTRRLFSSLREIHRLLSSGDLGELRSIEYVLGEPFAWPAATEGYFGAGHGGRGVLFDTGAHIVDLVCWWMGGRPHLVDYADDSYGGTEAVARLTLRHGDAAALIHLSWLSKLRNRFRVVGARGVIEGGAYEWSSYTRRDGTARPRVVRTDRSRTFGYFADQLLRNFTDAIAGHAAPFASAADIRPAVAVIEECYARRSRLPAPWHDAYTRLVQV